MNTLKLPIIVLALTGAHVVLTGCNSEDPVAAVQAQESVFAGDFDEMNYFIGPLSASAEPSDMDDPEDRAAAVALFRDVMPFLHASREVLRSDVPVAEKHRGLQEILLDAEELPDDAARFVSTSVAVQVLHEFKDQRDIDPIAVEPYVMALVEAESPNADLIHSGLSRLQGHWADERVRDAAARASRAAVAHLASECVECDREGPAPTSTAGKETRADAISAGVRALNRMAR
ncbi:MAG: hypothetical protein AAFQ43_04680 [Bacteroidota bacterium]